MQTCPGFFLKFLLESPGNLLEICSVKLVDTLCDVDALFMDHGTKCQLPLNLSVTFINVEITCRRRHLLQSPPQVRSRAAINGQCRPDPFQFNIILQLCRETKSHPLASPAMGHLGRARAASTSNCLIFLVPLEPHKL